MVEWLSMTWQEMKTSDVFQMWKPLGVLTGALTKSGVMNSQPLLDYLRGKVEEMGGHL